MIDFFVEKSFSRYAGKYVWEREHKPISDKLWNEHFSHGKLDCLY